MGSKALTDEEKEKYEKLFSEFLVKKIQNSCGSLPFQQLTSFLPQLPFEVRDAVGSSKVQLRKFLNSHPKKFKVDAKGHVTVVNTPTLEDDNDHDSESNIVEENNSLPSTIKNGTGKIYKIHNEFGLIKSIEPVKSTVYFRGPHFSGDKDSVLSNLDLVIGWAVCFNAVKGHSDCDAKYRATKVWRQPHENLHDEDVEFSVRSKHLDKISHSNANKIDDVKEDSLCGDGVIQKIFPQLGFISVHGREKETVYFQKRDLVDYDDVNDLQNVLKIGECVEFNAIRSYKKDSKAQWQANAVWKKCRNDNQMNEDVYSDARDSDSIRSYSNSRSNNPNSNIGAKNKGHKNEMIKDVPGKISPHTKGVNILFGEKYTEIVDGNSSVYFLYGSKVTDIAWEFSDGDDVRFDAVKVKSKPGWKAVLVWVGERPDYVLPTCLGDFSEFTDEELDEISEEKSFSTGLSKKFVKTNARDENAAKFKNKSFDNEGHSVCKTKHEFNREQKNYVESSRSSSQNSLSSRESNKLKNQGRDSKQKNSTYKHNEVREKPSKNRKSGSNSVYDYQHTSSLKGDVSSTKMSANAPNIFENQDETEIQTASKFHAKSKQHNRKSSNQSEHKFLRNFSKSGEEEEFEHTEVEYKRNPLSQPEHKFLKTSHELEDDEESVHNEVSLEYKKKSYGKASIKKYQGIEGKITKVHCKVAHAQNPDLQEPVHFLSNAFYCNGQSVEELQLDDLREKLSSGDTVKLNCFEIVNDLGELSQKVTLAYIGEEPKIFETTPEQFIDENDLSVTINEECDDQNVQPLKNGPKKFLSAINNSDSDDELQASASIKSSSSENSSNDETSLSSRYSKASGTNKHNVFEKEMDSPADYKLLSKMISQKLKIKGLLLFLDSKANLNTLSTEIVDMIVLRHHNVKKSDHLLMKPQSKEESDATKDSVCSKCTKKQTEISSGRNSDIKHKEVQTIVTGDIVAQSIFTET